MAGETKTKDETGVSPVERLHALVGADMAATDRLIHARMHSGVPLIPDLARHLIEHHGHHRLIIDPAADNAAAAASYAKVGFRPVGVMRQYERGPDGTWHDCLLMDLLAAELT